MDHVILVRSNQSNAYFPNNTTYSFKTYLNKPLYLNGEWEIALLDIHIEDKITKNNRHELYLCCDVCTGVYVFCSQHSLLRRIFPAANNTWSNIFSVPIYLPVKNSVICELEFYIKDENGEDASFIKKKKTFVLHNSPKTEEKQQT